ncbi:Uncharacterised protein [Mycobacteroides abscessus subsp. abscessus]|nr:Uncharacterised protein [Mycobacteroides abscessus subsp. abscessus]
MIVAVTPLDAEKITGAVSRVHSSPFCDTPAHRSSTGSPSTYTHAAPPPTR